jgi:acetolactate synthase-1/3 small subunit
MRHIISVLLENESGALSRVVGLFSQRGYNIETLTVAPPRIHPVPHDHRHHGDERVLEQIQKQLHKLVDVLKVCDLSEGEHIEREIALVKARAAGGARDELKRLADIFRGQIVDVTPELYTVQLVGTSEKLDAFIKTAAQTNEIIEVVRSGVCGISRADKSLRP